MEIQTRTGIRSRIRIHIQIQIWIWIWIEIQIAQKKPRTLQWPTGTSMAKGAAGAWQAAVVLVCCLLKIVL